MGKPVDRNQEETGQMGPQNYDRTSKGFKLWPWLIGIGIIILAAILIF